MKTTMTTPRGWLPGRESSPASAAGNSSGKSSSPAMRKLEHAAKEFEGILLASVWQAWNKSDQMGNQSDPIGKSMTGMGIEMASTAIAEKGGVGIARMIVNALKGEVTGQSGNRLKNS